MKRKEKRAGYEYALLAVIAVAIIGSAASAYVVKTGFDRVTRLQSLQTETERSLRQVSQLSNRMYRLLYDATDIISAQLGLEREYVAVSQALVDLSSHPGAMLIGGEVESLVGQTRELWLVATSGFLSANRQIEAAIEDNPAGVAQTNVSDTIAALTRRNTPIAEEERFKWEKIFIEMEGANNGLERFATVTLSQISSKVEIEASRQLRNTLRSAGITAGALATLVLVSLIAAVQLLHKANKRIAERGRAVQALLDASDEGFFSYKDDLIIQPETSRECATIFNREIAGERVEEALFGDDENRKESFREAMSMVFGNPEMADVVFGALGKQIEVEGKTIEILYRVIDEETLMGVLKDVTEQERMKREYEEKQETKEMVLRIVTSRAHFLSAVDEAEGLFLEIRKYAEEQDTNTVDVEALTRNLHTFKSNVAFLKMKQTAALAHDLETAIIDSQLFEDTAPLSPMVEKFETAFANEIGHVREAVGDTWIKEHHTQEVNGDVLREVYQEAREKYKEDREFVSKIEKMAETPLRTLFNQMANLAPALGSTRGKKIVVESEANGIGLDPVRYKAVADSLNHLIRNIVDHGIEFPRHREKMGKPIEGTIRLSAHKTDNGIEIDIKDDGGGIDPEKVREKAVEKGLLEESDKPTLEEVIRLIFSDGFSTAEAVTAVSGRGVGLSAVREEIKKAGGSIGVATSRGQGTTFKIKMKEGALVK